MKNPDTSHTLIPLEKWRRRELFLSFRKFEDACFSVSFEPEIAPLFRLAKARGDSFFLLTLFAIAKAYNAVPEMRQRFAGENAVAEYAVAHPSVPLMTADGESYVQRTLPYRPTFAEFAASASPIVESARRGNADGALETAADAEIPNLFCASCVPWFCAAGYSPATFMRSQDIHVLTWFKMTPAGTVLLNCRFNHCFTDGLHAARFFNGVAENFKNPETL